jgi:hypothetical protein
MDLLPAPSVTRTPWTVVRAPRDRAAAGVRNPRGRRRQPRDAPWSATACGAPATPRARRTGEARSMLMLLRMGNLARALPLPGSILMAVSIYLPQTQDCHGNVHTPLQNDSAWILAIAALLGLLPMLWRFETVRRVAPIITVGIAVLALGQVVLGIPFAIWLAWSMTKQKERDLEEVTASAATAFMIVLTLVFPIFSTINSHWLIGAYVTWIAAWIEVVGLWVWIAVARKERNWRRTMELVTAPTVFD